MGQRIPQQPAGNKMNHALFGDVEIVSDHDSTQSHQDKMKIQRRLNSQKVFSDWETSIKHFLNEDAKEIFLVPTNYKYTSESLCGSAGTLEIECQFYKHVLKTQIVTRHHDKVLFSEAELWYLLYNLLEAAFYLEPANKKIGDVHPSNIVINEKGRSKIVPTCFLPQILSNYEKVIESSIADSFLAPEEIDEQLIQKGAYPKVSPSRAEVFSIGVTILMAGTLCDCYYLYNRNPLQFSSSKKNDLMEDIFKNYSKYFSSVLSSMLQENPAQRRAASDLFRELNKFEDEILSLKDFQRPQAEAGGQILISEPSIADFLIPVKVKGGSELASQQRLIVQNFNSH